MSLRTALFVGLISVAWILASCTPSQPVSRDINASQADSYFYAREGFEAKVNFKALHISEYRDLSDFTADQAANTEELEQDIIPSQLRFLQGPITYRGRGAIRSAKITIDPTSAVMKDGYVAFTYNYEGTWFLRTHVTEAFQFPVPFNTELLQTRHWENCTDPNPHYQTPGFYFYFWDPSRTNCDQKENVEYQNVTVNFTPVQNTTLSYPEYAKMLKSDGKENNLQMTFGFGYMEDSYFDPEPMKDDDFNMKAFRGFLDQTRKAVTALGFVETPILQGEYKNGYNRHLQIGSRFNGVKDGVNVEIKIVAAAGLDNMDLFAKSYAHDHDAVYAWFGHSLVSRGTSAAMFKEMLQEDPVYYTISPDYQLVYWDGCTSYGYYLDYFLQNKPANGVDVISNGYSTGFGSNWPNANTLFYAIFNWENKASYQQIISDLEDDSKGRIVMVNVFGDEDNAQP